MPKSVVAFVGQNANGILEWWTREVLAKLETLGYEAHLIDLLHPDALRHLDAALKEGDTMFGFAAQGMGSDLLMNGQNLWDTIGVPFFSCMGDSPYVNPRKHLIAARRVYLVYYCLDFYTTYINYMHGPQAAVIRQLGFPENPHAGEKRWHEREIDLIYVKTGINPDDILTGWEAYPKILRSIARNAAEVVLSGSEATIADTCAASFAAANLHYGQRLEIFYSIANQVDHYVRAHRAARVAKVLLKLPARIYGNWDFLDTSSARATFAGSVPACDLPELYANSKVVANISPSTKHFVHERIIAGLMSKCAVLSDITPVAREVLSAYPSFFGFDVDGSDLEEQIMAQLDFPSDIEDRVHVTHGQARLDFSLDRFLSAIEDMIEMDAFAQTGYG